MAGIPSLKLSNGYNIPAIGLGTFQCKGDTVAKAINAAIDCGYRHFDTAHLYGNEKEIGDALRKRIEDGTVKREDLFIVTKLWNKFHHPNDVEKACLDSRDNFGLGYIDLFLMHWPFTLGLADITEKPDDSIDYLDTWKAMQSMVDKGYVKSLGVSNFNHKQLERLLSCKDLVHKPICNQIEVSPYLTNEKLLQFCKTHDITVVAFAPLGTPSNPWDKGTVETYPVLLEEPILAEIGNKYKKSPAQVAIRWGTQRGYSVIPKSATPSRIRENKQVFDFDLKQEEMEAISKLNRNFRYIHFDYCKSSIYYPFTEEY